MPTWYRIGRSYPTAEIIEVEVDHETKHYLFRGPKRIAKLNYYVEHYPSWEEAHAALTIRAHKRMEAAERQLRDALDLVSRVAKLRA